MKDDDKYSPPEASLGDHAHTLARAGVGSIPLAGAAATELFQKLIAPPLEKRRQEWMESVAEGLRQLEEQQRLSLDDLSENDTFIDAVMSASQAAIRTSQAEKREALKNAVLNSSLPDPPDESRQQIFIGLVDSLTVWHLRILRFFCDPARVFHEQGKTAPQYHLAGSLSQLLKTAYPELGNERELYDQIGKDLYGRGLLGTEGFHTMMSGNGVYEKRTTTMGDQFLRFISEPM
ncbi:hypothetical protein [Rosistilla oblonga]|uniref:Uncharacterized protein n=1 Tax=Rosistilla oblonga TaxID=2527990 RepID=A0A518IT29_9BACT|nr:hypothetical protein [Rosistilla oblonga]QDV56248.1 hypothetical protein Mal33_22300 [Rosistilla oblonga]